MGPRVRSAGALAAPPSTRLPRRVQKMFWRLLAEIQTGSLEQTYLSPLPSWVHVVGGRVSAAIAETAVVVGVLYGVINLFVRIDLHWRPIALIPLVLLIIGSAGPALVMAGITLVWKRTQMLNELDSDARLLLHRRSPATGRDAELGTGDR
jgi:hypothetical protein